MADTNTALVSEEVLDDLQGRFLTFNIGKVLYGIELLHVIEIISIQPITRIPNLPGYIKGIINLRGKVVPVIDVRLKFGQEERAHDGKTCIVIVMVNQMSVGLIVDSVAEVAAVGQDQSSAPPEFGPLGDNRYLCSIAQSGKNVILNIDIEKFFQNDLQCASV